MLLNASRRLCLKLLSTAALTALTASALTACAVLPGQDSLRISVVGIEPVDGQGLELRFKVRLRVLNPNDTPVDYDGVFVDLDLQGRNFASGASDTKGSVPRFGERVLEVPISVSALGALRQMLGLATSGPWPETLSYELRGKLGGNSIRDQRFESKGELRLSPLAR